MSRRKIHPNARVQSRHSSDCDRIESVESEPIVPADGPSDDPAQPHGNDKSDDPAHPHGDDNGDELVDFTYSAPGALPGTLSIPPDALPTELFLISDSPEDVDNITIDQPEACRPVGHPHSVRWIDARGLGTEAKLVQISETLGFHPLMLEDIVNVPHRPKIDFYDDKILIIMQMVRSKATGSGVSSEQVSFVLGQEFLATFQEEPEWDSFDPVRDRMRRGTGTIRRQGADYLAYALLDNIVDSFFPVLLLPVLEVIGETLEELEEEVVENPTSHTIEKSTACAGD